MAREAGFNKNELAYLGDNFQRLIDLARADEREEFQRWFVGVITQHEQLILAEREACAKVCEAVHTGSYDTPEFWREGVAYTCAAAIRARGNT
jgi:hypothetical protein